MARGPDGAGGGAGFSLADQLFNAETVGDLAREHAVLPGFDPERFVEQAVSRFPDLALMERLEWLADCLEAQLPQTFPQMADALEAAMPPILDPTLTDDDFGRFIHAVPGVLAVRHGLEDHHERALDLLYQATHRFSMEFYIRPFLNRWPEETLARLDRWVHDDNYHVRRLVSEGTRPKLPWAKAITLDPLVPLRYLDHLHADPARFVTRSVANHLNDLSKSVPDVVVDRLMGWQGQSRQTTRELDWITRHALRTAVKSGHGGALRLLGYDPAVPVAVTLRVGPDPVRIGEALQVTVDLAAEQDLPVMVDYRVIFARPTGREGSKVFKLKSARLKARAPLTVTKAHLLKANATTFRWHPGPHRIVVQVNGVDRAEAGFEVVG